MNLPTKIIIADDHPLFRMGVKTLIENLKDYHLMGEADNGDSAIELIEKETPDIAILDIDMPVTNGIEVADYVNSKKLHTKIIFLTSHSDLTLFKRAYQSNFSGFLFKESALTELNDCFQIIKKNDIYISSGTKEYLKNNEADLESIEKINQMLQKLTLTEMKVMRLISENKTSKEIADLLFNSYKTIENHRLNICHKLNIKGTNNLLTFAIKNQNNLKQLIDL